MTIGWIIFIVIVGLGGFSLAICGFLNHEPGWGWGSIIISLALVLVMVFGGLWYYNNTASGVRALKDKRSNLNNGLEREIIITAEDGREIYHYYGKCDIETNDRYIIFEDEDGYRQMIYWGITDTMIITEK